MNQTTKTYTTEEAAPMLNISTRTVKQYARAGRLKAQKIAGHWAFTLESINRFLEGEKQRSVMDDALSPFIPGLTAELDNLRVMLKDCGNQDVLNKFDNIYRRFINPMNAIVDYLTKSMKPT